MAKLVLCVVLATCPFALGQTTRESVLQAELEKLNTAVAAAPTDATLLAKRASVQAALGNSRGAIEDYDRAIELGPPSAPLYDARGSEYFKLGKIADSIVDFDRAIKLKPEEEPWHWKRGISYYYAERWDDGRRQFEGYQSVDDNDVENAVWRFLCMGRKSGLESARADMLKIRRDPRVPMMEIYELYAGRLMPDDVLRAAKAGSPTDEELNARQFYAHLYLGLYYEVAGNRDLAREHLALARSHRIGHYMWNVADVHTRRLEPSE
jgi:lipoprotein NlpI